VIDYTARTDSNPDDQRVFRKTIRPQMRRIGQRTQRIWSTWPNRENRSMADASGRPKCFATFPHRKNQLGTFCLLCLAGLVAVSSGSHRVWSQDGASDSSKSLAATSTNSSEKTGGVQSAINGVLEAGPASRIDYAVRLQGQQEREQVAAILRQATVDLIHLRRIAKQVHWNVTGPHFPAVHDLSADLADQLDNHIDRIAERSLALGTAVDGRVVTVNQTSGLVAGPVGFVPDFMMVRLISNRLATMSSRLREGVRELGALDLVAQDLLIDVKRVVDKTHWKFAVTVRDEVSQSE